MHPQQFGMHKIFCLQGPWICEQKYFSYSLQYFGTNSNMSNHSKRDCKVDIHLHNSAVRHRAANVDRRQLMDCHPYTEQVTRSFLTSKDKTPPFRASTLLNPPIFRANNNVSSPQTAGSQRETTARHMMNTSSWTTHDDRVKHRPLGDDCVDFPSCKVQESHLSNILVSFTNSPIYAACS